MSEKKTVVSPIAQEQADLQKAYNHPDAAEGWMSGHDRKRALLVRICDGDINKALRLACESGCIEVISDLIRRGATDINGGLRAACAGGWSYAAFIMIGLGANDWNGGLGGACYGSRGGMIARMAKHGATHCTHCGDPVAEHLEQRVVRHS